MAQFFALCGLSCERSEPGLRCKRLISQFGGLQDCRVLKIRGVRNLLRKYGVERSFTRSGAIEAISDGFNDFKHLYIEYRQKDDLKPVDVLRYLLARGVFRVGLEFKCPNCELTSWIQPDDVRTKSSCPYCDHTYDITRNSKIAIGDTGAQAYLAGTTINWVACRWRSLFNNSYESSPPTHHVFAGYALPTFRCGHRAQRI